MQKIRCCKMCKIILLVVVGLVLINGIRIYINGKQFVNTEFDVVNDIAYSFNRAQGNYVLYSEDNGIKTAPFIWGGRLFLYSIEEDKRYLIALSKGFNGEFGSELSLRGNFLYYSRDNITGGGGPIEVLNLKSSEHEKYTGIGGHGNYIATNELLYGVDDDLGVYKASVDTKEKKYIFEGEGYSYLDILGGSLIAYNEIGNFVMEKKLQADLVEKYIIPTEHYVIKIVKNEPDYFIYINKAEGTVVSYSKHDGATKTVAKFQEGMPYGEYYVCDTFTIKDDYLYLNDVDCSILRVNLNDSSITKIIDQSMTSYNVESSSISYCTDYIVIDTIKTAFFGRTKTLSVYDYSGKLIRKKHLTARN